MSRGDRCMVSSRAYGNIRGPHTLVLEDTESAADGLDVNQSSITLLFRVMFQEGPSA